MKRLLLYGFYGIENAGNEAMLRAFIEPIREYFKGSVEFIVANRHPDEAYDKLYGVRSIRNLEYDSRDKAHGRWLRGLNPDDTPEFMDFIREVSMSDLVVIGPGQYLVETGEFGLLKGSLAQLAAVVAACDLTHTLCYGLALTCEALSSPWTKLLIDRILPSLSCLTFRDQKSVSNLKSVGIQVPVHEVLGDLALAGMPADTALGKTLLDLENVPLRSEARLAVALRNIYWSGIDQDQLRQRLSRVMTNWLKHDGRDILMIPQNVYTLDGQRDDDRVAADKLIELLPQNLRQRIYQVKGKYEPAYTEALYGGCDVTLSARLHGSVFSCKQGTPPAVLTFMDKTRGFFDRLGHPECMVNLETSSEEISAKLEDFLERRCELSKAILANVDRVRNTASGYSQIAVKLLQSQPKPRCSWVSQVMMDK